MGAVILKVVQVLIDVAQQLLRGAKCRGFLNQAVGKNWHPCCFTEKQLGQFGGRSQEVVGPFGHCCFPLSVSRCVCASVWLCVVVALLVGVSECLEGVHAWVCVCVSACECSCSCACACVCGCGCGSACACACACAWRVRARARARARALCACGCGCGSGSGCACGCGCGCGCGCVCVCAWLCNMVAPFDDTKVSFPFRFFFASSPKPISSLPLPFLM